MEHSNREGTAYEPDLLPDRREFLRHCVALAGAGIA